MFGVFYRPKYTSYISSHFVLSIFFAKLETSFINKIPRWDNYIVSIFNYGQEMVKKFTVIISDDQY